MKKIMLFLAGLLTNYPLQAHAIHDPGPIVFINGFFFILIFIWGEYTIFLKLLPHISRYKTIVMTLTANAFSFIIFKSAMGADLFDGFSYESLGVLVLFSGISTLLTYLASLFIVGKEFAHKILPLHFFCTFIILLFANLLFINLLLFYSILSIVFFGLLFFLLTYVNSPFITIMLFFIGTISFITISGLLIFFL